MREKSCKSAIIEQFLADGIEYMFGNPGTVEQGFLDAIADYPRMKYILSLQESVAVMMADGYARATQRPALVQIHSTPGLGNAIGALYQANRGHAPLVVIGGDAGVKYLSMDAQMAGDLVAFARPVTKWSTMATDSASVLRVLRRAIKIAATPPMGPVYVCLPMDVMDAPTVEEARPTSIPSTRVAPDDALVRQAATLLAAAKTPMIFVGDGVAYSGAQEALTALAEVLGAEVWDADSGEVNMSYSHPLFQGGTGHMFGEVSRPIMSKGDVSLICGTYVLPEVFPELGSIFAPGSKVIHVDLDAYEIAKNHPVDLGMVSDPRLTLERLAATVKDLATPQQKAAAAERCKRIEVSTRARRAGDLERDSAARNATPIRVSRFMEELTARLPDDAIVFNEAVSVSGEVARHMTPTRTGDYFLFRGGSLGVGIPGAIGAKLANPGRTVVGFTGDGAAMYTIQALWSAARHRVDAKFVICNNSSYRLLQMNIDQYWKERAIPKHDYPLSFDLSQPPLGFVEMAHGMGVAGARVERPEEIGSAIDRMLGHAGPFLLDLAIEGNVRPDNIAAEAARLGGTG